MEKWKKLTIYDPKKKKDRVIEGKKGETYEVSNQGRMRKWHPGEKNPQILRGSLIRGYKVFNTKLTNGKGTSLYFHKLVAEQFLKRPSKDHKFVIHKDYEKENNATKNLKWVDKKGLDKHHKKNPNILNMVRPKGLVRYSKLSVADVKKIKKLLLKKNPKKKEIAAKFGITHTQLNRIDRGENWSHVTI